MVFTRRRLTAGVVGAMCASAPPPAGAFAPLGCFARVGGAAGDSWYCAKRRLGATPGYGGGGGGLAATDRRERRAAAVSRCSMTSINRIPPAQRTGRAARSGAAKAAAAAAAAARKRGRDRKPAPSKGGVGVSKVRYKDANSAGGGGGADKQLRQQHALIKGEPQAVATVTATGSGANPPPAKGFNRKIGAKKKKGTSTTELNAAAAAAAAPAGAAAVPEDAMPAFSVPVPSPPSSSSSSSSSDTNPLSVYFKTLKNIKLLKPDEEVILGRRIQKGLQLEHLRARLEATHGTAPSVEEWASALSLTKDELMRELALADQAKEHMISANLRLVVSMARNYRDRGLALPDLIQEGTMGLVKACEKFNPEMGFKFYTYAKFWIKKSIVTGIAKQSRVIRLPMEVHAFLSSIRKYTYELTVDGKLPTDEELGDKLGATVQKIQHYRKAALRTDSVSLDNRPANKRADSEADDLGNQIGATNTPNPEDATQAFYMKGKVTALLATLKSREQEVVRARYGLDGANTKTLDQIGRELGLTRERVRQIEAKALSKLRQPYRNYRVREHKVGQIFVDAGLREPASEAVLAARALIAEAEGLEKQQAAALAAAARVEELGLLAVAGDRPLKIEFKPGVDASESTQAVEAVLAAALDRAPVAAAAAAAAVLKTDSRRGAGKNGSPTRSASAAAPGQARPTTFPVETTAGASPAAGLEKPATVGDSSSNFSRVGAGLELPAVALTADTQRVLLNVASTRSSVERESMLVDAIRLSGGLDRALRGDRERTSGVVPDSAFAGEPKDALGADSSAANITPEEKRARDIESKRRSLNKAWNKKTETAVDKLERELARSAAALAMLEGEQQEWERSVGNAVEEQKSLSMASL